MRSTCVNTGRELKANARAYVQYWKDLMSAVAFAAHMDCVQLVQSIDETAVEENLDAMADRDDIPAFDAGYASRAPEREPYAGGEEKTIFAEDTDDAEDAVQAVQAWIGLAFSGFDPATADYWGVSGLVPLSQRWDFSFEDGVEAKIYTPLYSLDDYRSWQKESWRRKRNAAAVNREVEDLMCDA